MLLQALALFFLLGALALFLLLETLALFLLLEALALFLLLEALALFLLLEALALFLLLGALLVALLGLLLALFVALLGQALLLLVLLALETLALLGLALAVFLLVALESLTLLRLAIALLVALCTALLGRGLALFLGLEASCFLLGADACALLILALALGLSFLALAVALLLAFAALGFAALLRFLAGALGREASLFGGAALGLFFFANLLLALLRDLLGRRAHLDAKQVVEFFALDGFAFELLGSLAAGVNQDAFDVVAEGQLRLTVTQDFGDEAHTKAGVNHQLLHLQLRLGAVANAALTVVPRDRGHPTELLDLATSLDGDGFRLLFLGTARFLEGVNVAADRALHTADFLAVALENDVGGVGSALGTVAVHLSAVI